MANSLSVPERLANQLHGRKRGDPGAHAEQDFGIRIARDGTWFHQGDPIRRDALVKLFSTVVHRDVEGAFWLVTPVERGRIEVEDAPFLAVEMSVSGQGRDQTLSFRTNVDDIVTADGDHPIVVSLDPATGEPSPYVRVRDRLDALLARPVYYQLVDLAEERRVAGDMVLGVWSTGTFFVLGPKEAA